MVYIKLSTIDYWPNPISAIEKFKQGDRVKMTEYGMAFMQRQHRKGIIHGFCRSEICVLVVQDGTKTPQTFSIEFWEVIKR